MQTFSKILTIGLGVSIMILAGTFFLQERMPGPIHQEEEFEEEEGLMAKIAGRYEQEF